MKPLGHKAYGSIPHLPGSRHGPADKGLSECQASILTEKCRVHDLIIVEEKLDGSCCSVAKIAQQIVALTRAGYLARSSPYQQHHEFHRYVEKNTERFASLLGEGERCIGEWMWQAHGTRYSLKHEPFVIFDIMSNGHERMYKFSVNKLCTLHEFAVPHILYQGTLACSINLAMSRLGMHGHHGAIDVTEGAVWRVENDNGVDFLGKFVRAEKQDGIYLPEISGKSKPVLNS